jgi:hypothetical protein
MTPIPHHATLSERTATLARGHHRRGVQVDRGEVEGAPPCTRRGVGWLRRGRGVGANQRHRGAHPAGHTRLGTIPDPPPPCALYPALQT